MTQLKACFKACLISLSALAIVACATKTMPQHSKNSFHDVQYVSNYDGDTVMVDIPNVHPLIGERISVRVQGIDTPEIKGNAGCEKEKAKEAKKFVRSVMLKAKHMTTRM